MDGGDDPSASIHSNYKEVVMVKGRGTAGRDIR
jgi:hypothetical protein